MVLLESAKEMNVIMKGKEWFRKRRITDDIIMLDDNGHSNIFLVRGNERSMLIDTGWGIGDLPGAVSELTDKPVIIVNTHGHPDHVCGNYQFESAFITKEDEHLLKGCFDEKMRRWVIENGIGSPLPEGFSKEDWIHAKPGGLIHMQDGQVFDLGGRTIEVISVPGHTPGCVALLDSKDRMLLTGDTIHEGDVWMFLEESQPLEAYLSSLKKLDSLSGRFDMILPAHCGAPKPRSVINDMIRGAEQILDGTIKGKPQKTPHGEGLFCRFETCGIIYNENKLREL